MNPKKETEYEMKLFSIKIGEFLKKHNLPDKTLKHIHSDFVSILGKEVYCKYLYLKDYCQLAKEVIKHKK